MANDVAVRSPGEEDPARVRAEVVDRKVLLDQVAVRIEQLEGVMHGGRQDVFADPVAVRVDKEDVVVVALADCEPLDRDTVCAGYQNPVPQKICVDGDVSGRPLRP